MLDAVCFALYGDVPGDRATARRLRSDHADPRLAPRVVLETTLAGRRFRFTRSPAWVRPKKRGVGTTTEQASVTIAERVDGGWLTHTTRLDEAGHLVGDLVGMTLTQFTQVAMLPQGRFQAFLRARSEDRQQLLQRLFRTARFADIERWFGDRRRAVRGEAASHEARVADLVSRLSESAAVAPSWGDDGLAWAAECGDVARWSDTTVTAGHARAETATRAAGTAAARLERAEAALASARSLVEMQRRHAAARVTHERLVAPAPPSRRSGASDSRPPGARPPSSRYGWSPPTRPRASPRLRPRPLDCVPGSRSSSPARAARPRRASPPGRPPPTTGSPPRRRRRR
ncbi:MAG: AAA family ATPase [Nocardioides sp.]